MLKNMEAGGPRAKSVAPAERDPVPAFAARSSCSRLSCEGMWTSSEATAGATPLPGDPTPAKACGGAGGVGGVGLLPPPATTDDSDVWDEPTGEAGALRPSDPPATAPGWRTFAAGASGLRARATGATTGRSVFPTGSRTGASGATAGASGAITGATR
jgi:hypothetical protein